MAGTHHRARWIANKIHQSIHLLCMTVKYVTLHSMMYRTQIHTLKLRNFTFMITLSLNINLLTLCKHHVQLQAHLFIMTLHVLPLLVTHAYLSSYSHTDNI